MEGTESNRKDLLSNSELIKLALKEGRNPQDEKLKLSNRRGACTSDECWTCQLQFPDFRQQATTLYHYKYSNDVSPEEATETIRSTAALIRKEWVHLSSLQEQSGNAILSRWTSRNKDRRYNILREASPVMASHRWAHVDHWFTVSWDHCKDPEPRNSPAVRQAMLLPWLNIRDLGDDKTNLLALVHHRVSENPADWIVFDTEQIRYGRESGLLETKWSTLCFSVRDADYGVSRPFSIHELHRGGIYGYPIAELVFEAQAVLYSFLRRVVEIILRPEGAAEGAEKWDEEARKSFPGSKSTPDGPSRPPQFSRSPAWSTEECLIMAKQNMEDAEREFLQFQTDPIHAQTEVIGMIQSIFWRDVQSEELTKWNTAALAVFEPALRRAAMWDAIAVHIQLIHHFEKRTSAKSPLHLEESLQALLVYLEKCATAYIQTEINRILSTSVDFGPRLAQRVSKKGKNPATYSEMMNLLDKYRKGNNVEKSDWDKDKLFWAISHLCRWRYPPSPLMRAASEYLVESRFGANVAPELDDTSLSRLVETFEALQKLKVMLVGRFPGFHQARALGVGRFSDKTRQIMTNMIKEELHYTSGCSDFDHLLEHYGEWSKAYSYQIKDALGKFVAQKYPRDSGKLSEPALKKAIESRMAMKEFWEVIRKAHISRLTVTNKDVSPGDVESSKEVQIMHLYNEADEEIVDLQKRLNATQAKKAAAAAARGAKRDATAAEVTELEKQGRVPASDLPSPTKRRKTEKDKKAMKGAKKITAGVLRDELPEPVAVLEADQYDDAPALEEQEKDPESIAVTKDRYKVFAKLWPYQSEINDGKSCTFQQLRAAMQDAEMPVIKVDGSHYNFKGVHGALTLAAPHGRGSISKPLALWRRTQYGQTLCRRLGWTFESFVEEKK